ncbi:hypothetical protein EC396_01595 [Lutibacter sp. HS1-25]|nr:hypothetical protein EC396_01595 [Lutibacter sp. HS1-25]
MFPFCDLRFWIGFFKRNYKKENS